MNMDITQQTEPVRRTFHDVLRDNLRRANKVTFVHRLVYIGEHSFREHRGNSISDFVDKTIRKVNEEYHDERLTGLLLVYPKYFCHIIEGSEDSLFKHLRLLVSTEQYSTNLGRLKLLVCYHHCNQRFLQGWLAITGKPPTLLEKIDVNSDLYRTSRYVFHCVQKLYKLALSQRCKYAKMWAPPVEQSLTSAAVTARPRGIAGSRKTRNAKSVPREKQTAFLPEYGLLDFLLSTAYTQDLKTYVHAFGAIPPLESYKDKVWPVPTEFVPFNIFDKPYDPVTDLPTAKQEGSVDIFEVE